MNHVTFNSHLETFFQHKPYIGSTGLVFYGTNLDKNGITLVCIWNYLDEIKRQTVKVLPEELWIYVKQECDDLFRQASGNRFTICPAYWIGGLGNRRM